jgi:predicted transcriptional regulator
MKLKRLIIKLQNLEDFFSEIDESIKADLSVTENKDTIIFDNLESFRSYMSLNKINILSAISTYKPASVYELAMKLNRKPQHVLNECRSLESHGFINLIAEQKIRKTLRPKLLFDYDVIIIEDKNTMPIIISQNSKKFLELAI